MLGAREPQIQVQQILQTTQSWDGVNYQSYPIGQPQLTVLRIRFRPTLLCIGIITRRSALVMCYLGN
jgi:hypothetical protein